MSQNMKPEEAFKTASAQAHRASELAGKLGDVIVGNMKRKQTVELARLLREASCAATALDNWRLANPLPEDRENE